MPEQYLMMERAAAYKSEYLSGEIFAMAGAGLNHNTIAWNIGAELNFQLLGKPCRVVGTDMRVAVDAASMYTYPDVVVIRGQPQFTDSNLDTVTNATVIIEVLSKSTESYDRGEKFAWYRRLESLTDYILVAQDRYSIEHFVRQSDNSWLLTLYTEHADVVPVANIGCVLTLTRVYDKVDFEDVSAVY
jgi:Uma2 family endonuclease